MLCTKLYVFVWPGFRKSFCEPVTGTNQLILLFSSYAAYAQQCQQCPLADACIKEYMRATTKIKADYKKGVAELHKGREQTMRQQFSPRMALADQGDLGAVIQTEIDKLKDCLSKIR